MSVESARAFCVRMMSDDEFRNAISAAETVEAIDSVLGTEYEFSKSELARVVGEFVGRKLDDEELQEMVCGFYQEELNADPATCEVVVSWLKNKA